MGTDVAGLSSVVMRGPGRRVAEQTGYLPRSIPAVPVETPQRMPRVAKVLAAAGCSDASNTTPLAAAETLAKPCAVTARTGITSGTWRTTYYAIIRRVN